MHKIGIIGLAVMGRSLALNMADHGYQVACYNRSYEVTQQMMEQFPHTNLTGYQSLAEMVASLETPRKIILMVKAGQSVDMVLEQLLPYLNQGDMVLDGGNSFFQDTIARESRLKKLGIYYFGVGISGGEHGARFGPSIMPGGDQEAYANIKELLESIAAKAKDGSPCCTYIGEHGAGHFVKMVHNGIEYADMQIIAEAYLLLKHVGKLTNQELAEVFQEFQKGELHSYLIEITGAILQERDDMGEGELLDHILDASSQKGTGKWTSEEALRVGADVSMITAAYHARILSGSEIRAKMRKDRIQEREQIDVAALIKQVKEGMYAAKLVAYAQGFDLLKKAAQVYGWELSFDHIAGIFRAGCIIQAAFLDDIMLAYQKNATLSHLLLDDVFAKRIAEDEDRLRALCIIGMKHHIAIPALSSAISYLDSLQSTQVGANLIQAQRDYFGAHTYERTDLPGSFHHDWGQVK